MTLNTRPMVAVVMSHVAAGGHAVSVVGHEPKTAPGGPGEISAAVWFQSCGPTGRNSGLSATDALVLLMVRFYNAVGSSPPDEVDPRMTDAMDDLIGRITGDFTLGGTVDYVDLLGQTGESMRADAGHVELGRALQRVIDVRVPCVVHDVWTQAR